ncbi:MAG TPA: GNAT family N-acetyltransferase [Candidatus Cybelea sp.]
MGTPVIGIRPIEERDRPWLDLLLREHWGGEPAIVRGIEHRLLDLPALIAHDREGVAVYEPGAEYRVPELLLLHALRRSSGIGTALIDALIAVLRDAGHDRLLVTTSNDNLAALGFYQRRGFRLHAIRCGAVDEARVRKPTIPLVGFNGIELHDEIDLLLKF